MSALVRPLMSVPGARHPAMLAAGLLAVGVVIAERVSWSAGNWILISATVLVAVAVLLLASRRLSLVLASAAALLVLILGGMRFSLAVGGRPSPELTAVVSAGKAVELFGRVDAAPEFRLTGWRVPIRVLGVHTRQGSAPMATTVLLTTRASLDSLQYGDYVRAAVRLRLPHAQRNPGGFDYARHLFLKGIDAIAEPLGPVVRMEGQGSPLNPERLVEPVRQRLRRIFGAYLDRIPRALMLGFLIGETGELPPTVMAMVRDAGTLHLLAVSGANVWLVVALVLWPLRMARVPRWPRTIVLLIVVLLFCVLARNEPSVVRASIMVTCLLVGRLAHRPVHPINALGTAATIILVHSPTQLFRPGFQLSFVAVLAIVVVTRRVNEAVWMPRVRALRAVIMMAAASVAATLATAPIIAWHFGEVPLVSLPSNLTMIPLASMAIYLGAGLFLTEWVSASLGHWLAIPLSRCLEWSLASAALFSDLPIAVWRWPDPSPVVIAGMYAIFILALNWRYRYTWGRPAVYAGLALSVMAVVQQYTSPRIGVRLALLDTGGARHAVFIDNDREIAWLSDEPRLSYNLREWVVEPFKRAAGLTTVSTRLTSWRILDERSPEAPSVGQSLPEGTEVRWSRYVSADQRNTGMRRIWADRLSAGGHTTFHLRDFPTTPPGDRWLEHATGNADVVVLPASLPHELLYRLIDGLDAQRVILYGSSIPSRFPSQWLDSWRTRFPHIEFWATTVNGGIVADWTPWGIEISPSMTNSVWLDPDLE